MVLQGVQISFTELLLHLSELRKLLQFMRAEPEASGSSPRLCELECCFSTALVRLLLHALLFRRFFDPEMLYL